MKNKPLFNPLIILSLPKPLTGTETHPGSWNCWLVSTSFITQTPHGDGNLEFLQTNSAALAHLSLPKPLTGTETLSCQPLFAALRWLSLPKPLTGTETK